MTAVEKLEISLLGIISFDSEELRAKYKERIAKAEEMFKQQIIDAYSENGWNGTNPLKEAAEQYYNETFKNK
jgi:hypothetical protein